MKYLLMSDLHGSALALERLLEIYEREHCDGLICLGDLLYHGPRNPLPEGYGPKKVVELLFPYKKNLIWIQGNCDAEVDEMVLGISFHKKKTLHFGKRLLLLTHGHHLSSTCPSSRLKPNTIVLYGHFHRHEKKIIEGVTYLNLGSPSLPKDGIPQYGLLTDEGIFIYDLDNYSLLENELWRK